MSNFLFHWKNFLGRNKGFNQILFRQSTVERWEHFTEEALLHAEHTRQKSVCITRLLFSFVFPMSHTEFNYCLKKKYVDEITFNN